MIAMTDPSDFRSSNLYRLMYIHVHIYIYVYSFLLYTVFMAREICQIKCHYVHKYIIYIYICMYICIHIFAYVSTYTVYIHIHKYI